MEITKDILDARLLMQQHSLGEAQKFHRVADANYIALELDITRLAIECLERREAGAGEVVVEGWSAPCVEHIEDVRRERDEYCTEPVSCTIRRRAEKGGGGNG